MNPLIQRAVGRLKKNQHRLVLVLILTIGFILRAWGIGFGLPYIQNLDESSLFYTALYMAGNLGKPNVYVHGTIIPGIVGIFSGLYYSVGKVMGYFSSPDDFLIFIDKNPVPVVLFGRILNLSISLVSVGFVYAIGKRMFNQRVGIFASLFIAVSVLHVKESHYLKPDILAGLFSLLIIYAAYLISRKGNFLNYLFAGILVGVGIAVKFTLLLWFPLVLFAHVLRKLKDKNIRSIIDTGLIGFLSAFLLAFFAVSPYTFLDFRFFLSDFFWLKETLTLSRGYEHSPLWYYLFEYLKEGLGFWVWLLAFIGMVISCFNLKRTQYLLLLSFPFIFLASTNIWSKEHSQRYILPIVPYFVLLAAVSTDWIIKKIAIKKIQNKMIWSFFILLFIWQPLLRSMKFDFIITQEHTGREATIWIKKNIPQDSLIALEGILRPGAFPGHGPYLRLSEKGIKAELERISSASKIGRFSLASTRVFDQKNGYQILATPNLAFRYDPELGYWDLRDYEEFRSADYYVNKKVEYIVSNSWAHTDNYRWSESFQKSLEAKYTMVAEFTPTTYFLREPHQGRMDYQALDKVRLFTKDQVFGPVIKVYKKRNDT